MFCTNCGERIDKDNIKFCPYCGNEIVNHVNDKLRAEKNAINESSDKHAKICDSTLLDSLKDEIMVPSLLEPIIDVEWYENDKKEKEVMKLLKDTLGSASKYGDKLFLKSEYGNSQDDNLFAFQKKYEMRKPLLIFNYGESDLEGMGVDAYYIAFRYYDDFEKYLFKEIDNVFFQKTLMQPAMYLRLKNGLISSPIYLYGMSAAEEFVACFRKFLFLINDINKDINDNDDNVNILQENSMDKILKEICTINQYKSDYCEFGYPIKHSSNRMAQAMGYFNIDFSVNTYFIYDSSMSGKTCKEGFALCTDGFHYRYEKKTGIIPWKYYTNLRIKRFINCVNIDGMIFAAAFESKKILSLLLELQESLEQNTSQEYKN